MFNSPVSRIFWSFNIFLKIHFKIMWNFIKLLTWRGRPFIPVHPLVITPKFLLLLPYYYYYYYYHHHQRSTWIRENSWTVCLHRNVPYFTRIYKNIKAVPLKARTGPEGSGNLRLSEFLDSRHMKVVSLSEPASFISQEIFLVLISVSAWVDPRAIVRQGFLI
jgi:hypothetical protein